MIIIVTVSIIMVGIFFTAVTLKGMDATFKQSRKNKK